MKPFGVLLRFLGMVFIVPSVPAFFASLGDWHDALLALIIGMIGAGMHYAGRKLAPDAGRASVAGGITVVVAVIAGTVISIWIIFDFLFG
jgi:uncharacterized membrane protein YjjP (DUF1212 family)